MLFSEVFVILTYTFRRHQDFPDATGYAIKSGEGQRGETLKSLPFIRESPDFNIEECGQLRVRFFADMAHAADV